ncbi:MAG TPA: alpha-L-fucosidase, partial [Ignavibacteriaceae bacterium]|nr:alpha-L-fucosidase [Ignavibacteriaceae bacterium]
MINFRLKYHFIFFLVKLISYPLYLYTLIPLNPAFCIFPQEKYEYTKETDTLVLQKLEQWQDLKFGLLMHWGPYSQWGVMESWTICSEDWIKRKSD